MLKKYCFAMGLGVALAAGPTSAETLDLIVSWPESNVMAHLPAPKLKENLEAMDVDLEINVKGPETVPPFEQIGPASAGVFDIIVTHAAYHDRGIHNVTNMLKLDLDLIRSSGIFDYMDRYMQENHNLKLLANVPAGTSGYHCYLREPLSEDGDWSGRRIRGVNIYVPVIEALGGATVNTPMGEVYSGLERGVFDGACAPQSVFRATRHYEVAAYRTEPNFGHVVSYVAINLDTWNGLTEEQRNALTEASIKTEQDAIRIGKEIIEEDLDFVASEGIQVTRFPSEKYDVVLEAYQEGVWNVIASCCGEQTAKDLRRMATEADLIE